MTTRFTNLIMATALAALLPTSAFAAEGHGPEIERQHWSFSGFTGQYDKGQLQRGFLVYKEVCASCHGLKRVYFRNLTQPGGPEFSEESVKALAASWPNQITDGPNDEGKMFDRPAGLPDPILGPYKNDKEARANQNGALPPDLSLIAKARTVERNPSWWIHPFLMLGDIVKGYQEGGADYLYALLSGYSDPPEGTTVSEGMYYNKAFPGHQLAMPQPLTDDRLTEKEGYKLPPTVDNLSRDVTAFLAWTADPTLNQRKRIGWQVMLYLLVTTALLYLGKKRIWANIKH